ncbi:hypothetical protein WN944_023759 [Citrus x changshan-huyou]|uniref:Leucine-rich repeat-containing N-terminal plant-type domain-containing protein n=1 Tax=Citrus x changshan-huyou TaxID=2935761 RepID=A0AAP0LQ27_9ROSI
MERNLSLSMINVSLTHCLLLCLVVTAAAAASNNITTDQQALLALKDHITYDPTNLFACNWTSNTSVCTWIGITYNVNSHRVTALDISQFNLQGTIPPQLLSGSVSSIVFNMSSISDIRLTNNRLSDRSTNACVVNGEDTAVSLLQQFPELLGFESPFIFFLSLRSQKHIRDADGFAGVNRPKLKLAQGVYGKTIHHPTFSEYSSCPPFSGDDRPSWVSNHRIVGKRGTSRSLQWFGAWRNCRDFMRSCPFSLSDEHMVVEEICLRVRDEDINDLEKETWDPSLGISRGPTPAPPEVAGPSFSVVADPVSSKATEPHNP